MEISVESAVEVAQTAHVREYIDAWGLPKSLASEVMEAIHPNCADPIGEAEKEIHARLNELLGGALGEEETFSTEQKLALLWADLPAKIELGDSASLSEAYQCGMRAIASMQQPQRPLETHPMVMQTSLTRLPSIRILVGWVALIGLLILAFILTR